MGIAQRFQKTLPMVRQKIVWLLVAGLTLFTLIQFPASVGAAQSVELHGITVSPAIEYIKLKQNQDNTSFITTITNHTKTGVIVTPTTRDFTASSDGRKLTFVKNNESSSTTHGLSDVIQVTAPNTILEPGKSVEIPVKIENANSLAPGGHYAAIIFGVKSAGSENSKIVSVREAVSCLVFLNTFSGGTQTTKVAAFPVNGFTTSLPQNANIVLANTGNTQTIPRGYVQITGPGGKTVVQGIINVDSSMILPGSKRLFPVALSSHGNRTIFGVFHEKLYYRHDGQEKYMLYDQKFFYVNVLLCFVALLAVLAAGVLSYFVFKLIRKKIKRTPKKPKSEQDIKNSQSKKSIKIVVN